MIESAGISKPLPVAETFTFKGEDGRSLSEVARLDTMATVVDAASFLAHFRKEGDLRVQGIAASEDDDRTFAALLIEQVEFADVFIPNKVGRVMKVDQVTPGDLVWLEAILTRLNLRATIVQSRFVRVDPREIMGTGRFDFARAAEAPGWLCELRGEHVPEIEEHGIESFVCQSDRPVHPVRFYDLLNSDWPGVLGGKRLFWIASRPDWRSTTSRLGRGTDRASRPMAGGHAPGGLARRPRGVRHHPG